MKAPLLFSLFLVLLLSGAADGLSGLQSRFQATQLQGLGQALLQEREPSQAPAPQKVQGMGQEAAGAEELSAQDIQKTRAAILQPEHAGMPQSVPCRNGHALVRLEGNAGESYHVEVFDISGMRVLSREGVMGGAQAELPLQFQHAADGVYVVKATVGEKVDVLRCLHQRVG